MVIEKRKGDVTISTVIFIVLGLVVLVMLIIGFTQGFDTLFGIFKNAPSDLQEIASVCEGYALGSLTIDYCKYRIIDMDGTDEIVNCLDSRITDVNTPKGVKLLTCTGNGNLQSICEKIPARDRQTVKVNNVASDKATGTIKCTAPPVTPPAATG